VGLASAAVAASSPAPRLSEQNDELRHLLKKL